MSHANDEKTIEQMTAEIRAVNIEKGWRTADGGLGGDYLALLHSELSEALEAYRDHRLADATQRPKCQYPECPDFGDDDFGEATCPTAHASLPKPEGVGSEFADVLIRLLDTCDVIGVEPFEPDLTLADVAPIGGLSWRSFGEWIAWLHALTVRLSLAGWTYSVSSAAAYLLRALIATCEHFGIDLTAEYERKITYNRTRPYQHGGRTLADA